MGKRDDIISEADWKDLLKYWRSPKFEARSARAKENRAKSTVLHTFGNKSHARVTQEMLRKLSQLKVICYCVSRTNTYSETPNDCRLTNLGMPLGEIKCLSEHIRLRKDRTKDNMCHKQHQLLMSS